MKKLERITIYHQTEGCLEQGSVFLDTHPYIEDLPSIRIDLEETTSVSKVDLFDLLEEIPALLEIAYKLGQQNPDVEITQLWK